MGTLHADTLPIEESRRAASDGHAASLVLTLEYQRPFAGSLAFDLGELDELIIGRGDEREVRPGARRGSACATVPDPWMSRGHARLARAGGRWRIVDLDSKNGILVEGVPCRAAPLVDGSRIEIGQTAFVFRAHPATPRGDLADELGTFHAPLVERLASVARVAGEDIPILLMGDTGTGKEMLAQAIHRASGRPGPLVAVDCAALPAALIESELFGCRKGAFSGAHSDRPGLVRSADGGTLFLDELGELSLASQAVFLRVLQERRVTHLGDAASIPVDLRVIGATNRDLPAMVASGTFRADLYARLSGLVVRLPPLRDRPEDVGALVVALLARLGARAAGVTFSKSAARAILRHGWPHNVRELAHCLAAAVALGRGGVVERAHLEALPAEEPDVASAPASEDGDSDELRTKLLAVLASHQGNVAAVGRELGRAPVQIYRWMRRYGIRPAQFRG